MKYIGKDPEVLKQFVTAAASGSISAGDTCIIETDGDITAVLETSATQAVESPVIFDNNESGQYFASAKDPTSNYIAVVYEHNDAYQSNDHEKYIVFGSISGSTVTFNTPIQLATQSTEYRYHDIKYTDDGTILYARRTNNTYGGSASLVIEAFVITPNYSANTISKGTAVVVSGTSVTNQQGGGLSKGASNKFVCLYTYSPNNALHAKVLTVSGTTVSVGSEATVHSTVTNYFSADYDSTNDKHLITYQDSTGSNYATATVGTVSGTSITFGTPVVVDSTGGYYASLNYAMVKYISSLGKFAFIGSFNSSGEVYIGEISGTSSTWGSGNVFDANYVSKLCLTYDSNAEKVVFFYYDHTSPYGQFFQSGTISGTTVTFDTRIDSGVAYVPAEESTLIFDSSSNKCLLSYGVLNNTTPVYPSGIVYTTGFAKTNMTTENFIGFADKDYADGSDAVVQTKGAVDSNQTGLIAGQSYYVQNDGTLSITADDPSVFAGTAVSATQLIVKG